MPRSSRELLGGLVSRSAPRSGGAWIIARHSAVVVALAGGAAWLAGLDRFADSNVDMRAVLSRRSLARAFDITHVFGPPLATLPTTSVEIGWHGTMLM